MSSSDANERPVTVIGGGILGRRLCLMWSCTGRPVNLYEKSPENTKAALDFIDQNISTQLERTGRTKGKLITFANLADAVADAWLVIEAIPEVLDLKIKIFGELDKLTRLDCILASNSSSFRSSLMLEQVEHKERVLNMHYYMPTSNNCVELMSSTYTKPELIDILVEANREVGFKPMIVRKQSTGLIFNRVWAAIKREALMVMAEDVAEADEIDELFKDWFKSEAGPCEMMDNVGLDTVYNIEKHYVEELSLDSQHLEWLKANYLDSNKLGRKTGGEGLLRG